MRKIYLLILIALVPIISFAQPWHFVTVNSGTQNVGGIVATVTKNGSPGIGGSCNTINFPYHIGNGQPNSYTYSFSNTVGKVRLRFADIGNGEEIKITYNGGTQYVVTSPMINNYTGSCVPTKPIGNVNGNITNISSSNADGELILSPGGGINNITIAHLNGLTTGCYYDLSFYLDTPVVFKHPFIDTMLCAGGKFNLDYIVNSPSFTSTNVFKVELSNSAGVFSGLPVVIGSVTSKTTGVIPCTIPANTASGTNYRIRIVSSSPSFIAYGPVPIRIDRFALPPFASQSRDSLCEGDTIYFETKYYTPGLTVNWSGPAGYFDTGAKPMLTGLQIENTGDYYFEASIGACRAYDTLTVEVFMNPPIEEVTSNAPLCEFDTLRITLRDTVGLPITYEWAGPNGFYDTVKNPVIENVRAAATGTYYIVSKLGICLKGSSVTVQINTKPELKEIKTNSPIFPGNELKLDGTSPTAGVSYSWVGPDMFTSDLPNPTIPRAPVSASGKYTVTLTLGPCSTTVTTNVVVTDPTKAVLQFFPNPVVNNQFRIRGITKEDKDMPFILTNLSGYILMEGKIPTDRRLVDETISLPGHLANGLYFLKIRVDGEFQVIPITIMK